MKVLHSTTGKIGLTQLSLSLAASNEFSNLFYVQSEEVSPKRHVLGCLDAGMGVETQPRPCRGFALSMSAEFPAIAAGQALRKAKAFASFAQRKCPEHRTSQSQHPTCDECGHWLVRRPSNEAQPSISHFLPRSKAKMPCLHLEIRGLVALLAILWDIVHDA